MDPLLEVEPILEEEYEHEETPGTHETVAFQVDSQGLLLLDAAGNGDLEGLRRLLNEGADLRVKSPDGRTALHAAVRNSQQAIVLCLLDNGVDLEAVDSNGCKALYTAAQSGNLAIVELLLYFNADVEAFNPETKHTAFHQACLHGHVAIAKALREKGADIDTQSSNGRTPLFGAVFRENFEIVEFLLQNGANRKIRDEDGFIVEDIVSEGTPMMQLSQSDQVLQGPSISEPRPIAELRFTLPFLAADQVDKLISCHGFEATIVDFFVGETEQRIQKTASIHEILYGKGPESIMKAATGTKMSGKQPNFRWYHLPANNMEWVEMLASRHFGERSLDPVILNENLKCQLALSNSTGQQYRATTAHSSFMRPQCREVQCSPGNSLGDENAGHIMLFIPFLHFETYRGYQRMVHLINEEKDRAKQEKQPPAGQQKKPRQKKRPPKQIVATGPSLEISSGEVTSSDDDMEAAGAFMRMARAKSNLRSAFRDFRGRVKSRSEHVAKTVGLSKSQQGDLETGLKTDEGVEALKKDRDKHTANTLPPQSHPAAETKLVGSARRDLDTEKFDEEDASRKAGEEKFDDLTKAKMPEEPAQEKEYTAATEGTKLVKVSTLSVPARPPSTPPVQAIPVEQVELPTRDKHDNSLFADPRDTHQIRPGSEIQNVLGSEQTVYPLTSQNDETTNKRHVAFSEGPKVKNKGKGVEVSGEDLTGSADATQQAYAAQSQNLKIHPRRTRVPLEKLDEYLVKGYLFPDNLGDSPLQLRRTLDQYFYTHLASTSERDSDQVVYRYTKHIFSEPKMFMVDQLWLWILNNDTIISCCPLRWDIWSEDPPNITARAQYPPAGQSLGSRHRRSMLQPERPRGSPPPAAPPPGGKGGAFSLAASEMPRGSFPQPPQPSDRRRPSGVSGSIAPTSAVPLVAPQLVKQENLTGLDPNDPSSINKPKDKKAGETSGVLGWIAGKSSKPPGRGHASKRTEEWVEIQLPDDNLQHGDGVDNRPSSSEEKQKRLAFLQQDPLNVHQLILKYLQGSARAPITSVTDLATLITDSCIGLFDQYQIPDEFQFFDFFERSIGAVIDGEAKCFRAFAESLDKTQPGDSIVATDALYSITAETKLLVEIKDIRDELSILQTVLEDQLKPAEDFIGIVEKRKKLQMSDAKEIDSPNTQNTVLESHLYRVEKMEKLAKKTHQALNHLLDLKQKQANVSEALSARKQAEQAFNQAKDAKDLTKQGLEQATAAQIQARETTRQGRTVLVFTVITIIFLPLSFMAAFFAINIDSFPSDENGKLSMDYVLKYMLSISGAISLPFITIALNQDRIAEFLKEHKTDTLIWGSFLLGMAVLLSVVWTRDLGSGIKAAVTVAFVLIAMTVLSAQTIYWLISTVRGGTGGTSASGTGSGSSRSLVDD